MLILLVLVAIYMFSANTSIFKKPKNKESFQDDDDANESDNDTNKGKNESMLGSDADTKGCKEGTCPLVGKIGEGVGDKETVVNAKVPVPQNSNILSIYESFQSDMSDIKEDLAFIKKQLTKNSQPQNFDAFYRTGYY